jgi:hypothetical protein
MFLKASEKPLLTAQFIWFPVVLQAVAIWMR